LKLQLLSQLFKTTIDLKSLKFFKQSHLGIGVALFFAR
jgi:hypothetical protein